jgi:hypothetical protein
MWVVLSLHPHLVPVTQNLLAFNRRTNHLLGVLPQFLVTLGGKIFVIDVMVFHDPLDFDLLLGRDYVYAMKAIVSTLFRVIYLSHDGRVVTIGQLSFIVPNLIINPTTSLNSYYMQMVSPSPQVNYVVLSPMPSIVDEDEPFIVILVSYDLDPIFDMVICSIWILEPDLLTPVTTLVMCSFQSVFLPSSEDLLESMSEFCPLTWCPSRELSYWNL